MFISGFHGICYTRGSVEFEEIFYPTFGNLVALLFLLLLKVLETHEIDKVEIY